MSQDAGLVIVAMMIVLTLAGLGFGLVYLLTLQRAIELCAPKNRTISPAQVWLNLIPLVNIVWQFVLVSRISETLDREFSSRSRPSTAIPDDYGRRVGLAMCVLAVVSFIPYVGILTGVAGFVCWIVYWMKVSAYSRALAEGGTIKLETDCAPVYDYAPGQKAAKVGAQWFIVLVLVIGYGASYFQRLAPSVVAPMLRSDLNLTAVQLGLVFSTFPLGMIAGYCLMTILTTLCGTRWGLVASFAGVSLAASGSGFLPGYGGLVAARFLLGFFTAGLLPVAVQYTRDWLPSRVRPLVIGALIAAGPGASLLAPVLLNSVALRIGWRLMLIVTALPTLIAALLCLAVWPKPSVREPFRGVSRFALAATGIVGQQIT